MTSGSEKRQRSEVLRIRLTADERAAVAAFAERAGLTMASYARQVLLTAPAPRAGRRPVAERVALAKLLAELGRAGSNVNQIARSVNYGRLTVLGPEPLDALQAEILEIRAALMRALGREP